MFAITHRKCYYYYYHFCCYFYLGMRWLDKTKHWLQICCISPKNKEGPRTQRALFTRMSCKTVESWCTDDLVLSKLGILFG